MNTYDEKLEQVINALLDGELSETDTETLKARAGSDQALALLDEDTDHDQVLFFHQLLQEYFAADAPLSTAAPLSYTFRNLGDNTPFSPGIPGADGAASRHERPRSCIPGRRPGPPPRPCRRHGL